MKRLGRYSLIVNPQHLVARKTDEHEHIYESAACHTLIATATGAENNEFMT